MTTEPKSWTAVVAAEDEDVRALLHSLLVLEGIQVVGDVAGAKDAVVEVERAHPSLLVIGRRLSDGEAQALAETAKGLHPDLWTVVVSSEDPSDADPIFTGPMVDGVVRRPFHRDDFVRTLPPPIRGDR